MFTEKKRFPKLVALMCVLLLLVCSLTACGGEEAVTPPGGNSLPESSSSTTKTSQVPVEEIEPDVKIEDIEWTIAAGVSGGKNYVLMEVKNNSTYTIKKFELDLTEKATITKEEKEAIYDDIQKSQGFDDAYMEEYKKSREELKQPITMYGNCSKELAPSQKVDGIKCYYIGGWTSKEVLHSDKFVPEKAKIEYVKDGTTYTVNYNFDSKKYELEK